MLTSLVSAEKVRILGAVTIDNVQYFIVDYANVSGESGTGLVDDNDNLFVLKSSLSDKADKGEISKFLGSSTTLSLVYGPLKFR